MNSAIDTPKPAERDRLSTTQRVAQFHGDVRADNVLRPTFESVLGGHPAGFDVIAPEVGHDGR